MMLKFINRFILYISICLLGYVILLNLLYGSISFSKVIGLLSILGIIYGLMQLKNHDTLLHFLPTYLKIILYIIVTIGVLLFIVVEGNIVYYANHVDNFKVDKVIILGAGLKKDQISTSLKYRLDQALEYYQTYPNTTFIVSGGQGKDETISESTAMKNYLVGKGIDESLIIEEGLSTNTYENFKFSKQYLQQTDKVLVITNDFHVARAKLIASRLGIQVYTLPAKSHLPSLLNFYIREFFAYIKDFILIQ